MTANTSAIVLLVLVLALAALLSPALCSDRSFIFEKAGRGIEDEAQRRTDVLCAIPWKDIGRQNLSNALEPRQLPVTSESGFGRDHDVEGGTKKGTSLACEVKHWKAKGYSSPCAFVQSQPSCKSDSIFEYLSFHYCTCSHFLTLSASLLLIWLALLIYLLGNTAADYFCPNVEHLARLLKLPPTVAGVTLMPLGNGAPDVFASIAAFMRPSGSQSDVGLNGILGAAVFVSTVVMGAVSIAAAAQGATLHNQQQLHKETVLRDISFQVCTIAVLLVLLWYRSFSLLGAAALMSVYIIYAIVIGVVHYLEWVSRQREAEDLRHPLLSQSSLEYPDWRWSSKVAVFSHFPGINGSAHPTSPEFVHVVHSRTPLEPGLCTEADCEGEEVERTRRTYLWTAFHYLIEVPLMWPRKLTISLVETEEWDSRVLAATAVGGPALLLYRVMGGVGEGNFWWLPWAVVLTLGAAIGLVTYKTASPNRPPEGVKALPWVAAGFVSSLTWFSLIANELVALLTALGEIAGVAPALLSLTVLAWGNSVGDLVANTALASRGAAQMAVAATYSSPIFNMSVGLGLSMLLAAIRAWPKSSAIAEHSTLFLTVGFLVAALLTAVVGLGVARFHLTKGLGYVLMTLYLIFLSVRVLLVLDIIHLPGRPD